MKKLISIMLGAVAIFAIAAPAQAHTGYPQRLRKIVSGDASARWQSLSVDSPLDANRGRFRMEVAVQSGDDFVKAFEFGSGVRHQTISSVRNLSFDFLSTASVGIRSPRIEVSVDEDGNGTTDVLVYLIASRCDNPIGSSVWHRADFTGERGAGACTVRTSQGTEYSSDGTQSAWDSFVDAYGLNDGINNAVLLYAEAGTSYIDRLAFHNHLFGRGPARNGNQYIVHCSTEASC